MGAKAVVVFNSDGVAIENAIAFIGSHLDKPSPLTNAGGYALLPFSTDDEDTWIQVIADGYSNYIHPVVLSSEDQNICCGAPASGTDVQLPPLSFRHPSSFQQMDTYWKGNDCGIHLSYLPPVEGGSSDPTLFVAWMYPRYPKEIRDRVREDYSKHFTHIALSWPDDAAWGYSPLEALKIYQEWDNTPVRVGVFLTAKGNGYDHNVDAAFEFAREMLEVAVGVIPCFIDGWEESLWLNPDEIWELASLVAAEVFAEEPLTLLYIHLQEGYMSFPFPDKDNASFWWPLQGLVHGILLQKRLSEDDSQFTNWLQDCLQRFNGGWNMPPTNGIDGECIQGVAWELNYMTQFFDGAPTSSGNHLGDVAIAQTFKEIEIMGSGNGQDGIE